MKLAIQSMISSRDNFGSNLQNFALQRAVQKNFPDLVVYSVCWKKGLDPISSSFHRFIMDHMNLDIFDGEKTDFLLFGSDQIWNYRYFINCAREDQISRYTLAPASERLKCFSFATSTGGYTEDIFLESRINTQFILNILSNFNYPGAIISLRERYSEKKWRIILDNLGFHHIKIRYDIDPTFLLPSIEYLKLMRKPNISLPENFSIKYMTSNMKLFQKDKTPKKEYLKYIEKIQKDPDYQNAIDIGDKELANKIGIEGFFYLIRYANKVFTDSFHGFVFFVILRNKNFIISPPSGDLRIENIKEILNIKIKNNQIVNGEEIDMNIKRERLRSLNYLMSLFDPKKYNDCT